MHELGMRRWAAAFETGGDDYQRLRPGYPTEAVRWVLETAPEGPVVDVGAGTGKLTGVLLDLDREVVAVDPSLAILDRLRTQHPGVSARQGTAEHTGLAPGSATAVVLGQAWHWVDPVAASAVCEHPTEDHR